MLYVALVLAGALVAVVISFAGVVRSLVRQHARERDLLINQLLHATGKPWQPAPETEAQRSRLAERHERERSFTLTPEQEPVG